jgi:hypothetical protein
MKEGSKVRKPRESVSKFKLAKRLSHQISGANDMIDGSQPAQKRKHLEDKMEITKTP